MKSEDDDQEVWWMEDLRWGTEMMKGHHTELNLAANIAVDTSVVFDIEDST